MKIFCPYRICPIGAHVDHQKGLITGFAIDKGIIFEFSPSNDEKVLLTSNDFKGIVSFEVNGLLELKDDWGNYMRGVTKVLRDNYCLKYGITGKFTGQLPIGGLSSSSAVTLSYLKALCMVNNVKLNNMQLIDYSYYAEFNFIGLKNGKLDQSCEVLCKKNHYLYLDTKDMSYELIPENPNHVPYEFLIVYSGQSRKLINSAYNVRVDECKSAAYLTKALQGIEYGKYKDTYLSDLDFETFKMTEDRIPLNWKKRAYHFYNENNRVKLGIEAWKNGNMKLLGSIIKESGISSIELYEAGSNLLKDLNNIINSTNGVYGGRFMGGGFNGCCFAIIDPTKRDHIISEISNKYISLHPEMGDLFGIYVCKSGDGIGVDNE